MEGARRRELWKLRVRVGAGLQAVQGRGRRKERSNVTVSSSRQIDGVPLLMVYGWCLSIRYTLVLRIGAVLYSTFA